MFAFSFDGDISDLTKTDPEEQSECDEAKDRTEHENDGEHPDHEVFAGVPWATLIVGDAFEKGLHNASPQPPKQDDEAEIYDAREQEKPALYNEAVVT
jgi:hypothetical protein